MQENSMSLIYVKDEDELRTLTARGQKLLCSLMVLQNILLYHSPDSSWVNRLWLRSVFESPLRSSCTLIPQCSVDDTSDILGGFNHELQSPPAHLMPVCNVSSQGQDDFLPGNVLGESQLFM